MSHTILWASRLRKVERRRARGVPTFAELALADFEHRKGGWRSAKHARDWKATLERFVFPHLGARTVDGITTDDVFRVLSPIWHAKPATAKLVRQRIGAVLAVAVAKGLRPDNPADAVKAMLARHQSVETKGHRSLPYAEVARALAKVRASKAHRSTVLALEFLVLTAARAGEVRFTTWRETDADGAIWTVPAERMKAGREHRVPLSARALDVLSETRGLASGRSELVFPGRTGNPVAERAFVQVLDRLGIDATAHGFRSIFRSPVRSITAGRRSTRLSWAMSLFPPPGRSALRRYRLDEKRAQMDDMAGTQVSKAREKPRWNGASPPVAV